MGSTWRRLSLGIAAALSIASLATAHAIPSDVQEAVVAGQTPPRDRPQVPEPTGTGRISGQLVAADSGAPVKRARVTLISMTPMVTTGAGRGVAVGPNISSSVRVEMGVSDGGLTSSGPRQKQTETDNTGRFEFTDLPAGRYSVMVVPQSGFVRPQQPQSVQVDDGGAAALTVRLDRTGAVTGHVFDDGGDPIARAQVRAIPRGRGSGMGGGLGSFGNTDDRGEFRLYDLQPGEYYISASHTSYDSTPGTGLRMGFAPTYFPGATAKEGAQAIAVRSGLDTPGIDFSLVRARMGRITGTARDAAGQPLPARSGNISLNSRNQDGSSFARGASLRPDGTFEISSIPPGEYFVTASLTRGEGPDAPREGAYVPVTVDGDEQTIDIRTNTGATVAGRVVVEGTTPPLAIASRLPAGAAKLRVSVRQGGLGGPPMIGTNMRPADVADDGTFQLTGVRGSVLFTASGSAGAVLKSVTSGGNDVSGPLEFKGTENVRDMLIVLTRDVGRIEGTVVNSRGEPQMGAGVIIFPDDPERWFLGSPFVTVARTMQPSAFPMNAMPPVTRAPGSIAPAPPAPGQFRTPMLLPGRYLLVALEPANSGAMPAPDRESLTKLRQKATSVTVVVGEKPTTVQLQVSQ